MLHALRITTGRSWGANIQVMKIGCAKIYNHLQRWVNNRFIFEKCKKFEDYRPYF